MMVQGYKRGALSFFRASDITLKLQKKLPVQATCIKTTKKPLCWQILAEDLSTQTIPLLQLYDMI